MSQDHGPCLALAAPTEDRPRAGGGPSLARTPLVGHRVTAGSRPLPHRSLRQRPQR